MAIISFTNYKRGQSSGCMGAVMRYTMQDKKTLWNGQQLVTGINCQPDTAYADFMMTKRLYRKTDGVMFYHMVQSFPKDETVNPVTAHAAALKLAEYYAGYEVLVCTHTDRDHIHSHFLINSVNFDTGRKLHIAKEQLQELRQRNDQVCVEFALPVFQAKDTYKKKGKDVCSGHYIREQELNAILLDDIRRITHFARQNELRFAEHIQKKQGKETQREIAALQKRIDAMGKRQTELTKLFKRLYEDSVLGRIPDEQYRILSQEYTTEQKEIQVQLPAMEARLQELKDSSCNIARFIENAKRYSEIPELTSEILHIFIRRVEVGERAEKYSRTAAQEIRIYYRDVGLVDELPQSIADAMTQEISDEVA